MNAEAAGGKRGGPMKYDVIVIGGGLHGSSTAYHLAVREPGLRIAVVERDPAYEHAASIRSTAGVRVMFSQEENVRMSQYGHEFYRGYERTMTVDGDPATVSFRRQGYLHIATSPEMAGSMRANHALQRRLGCNVDLLDAAGTAARFPSLRTGDMVCATHSPDDGWIDSHGALTALRRKARALGVSYIAGSAAGLNVSSGLVRSVALESGEVLEGDRVVNNAGAWGARGLRDGRPRHSGPPHAAHDLVFRMPGGDRAAAAHHGRRERPFDRVPARRRGLHCRHIRLRPHRRFRLGGRTWRGSRAMRGRASRTACRRSRRSGSGTPGPATMPTTPSTAT